MRTALQITGKAVAAFGFVSVSMTLVWALLLHDLRSDDPYVLGAATAIIIVPAVGLLLSVERRWGRRAGTLTYTGYVLLVTIPLIHSILYAELHGPGIALVNMISNAILAPIVFLLVRAAAMQRWLVAIGWAMAIVYLIGLVGANCW